MEFGCRPESDAEVMLEFTLGAPTESFGDVGRDGDRRPSNLRRQAVCLDLGKRGSELVAPKGKLLGDGQDLKALEITHEGDVPPTGLNWNPSLTNCELRIAGYQFHAISPHTLAAMPLSAFALVLAAAVLHASWNLLLKASGDRLVAAAVQAVAGALVLLPFLIAGGYPTDRWLSLIASGAFHLGYGLTLIGGYDRGDLSVIYPVARGTSPLLVTVGAALFLDDALGVSGVLGVMLVAAGIIGVVRRPGRGVAWALACGCCIAGYTLVDGGAVRAEGGSLRYTAALFLTNAVTLGIAALLRRGRGPLLALARSAGVRQAAGGAASAAAYLLVLIAARRAPLGSVSAVRETSVVIGALAGWRLLGEPLGRQRMTAAAVIAAGVVLLML